MDYRTTPSGQVIGNIEIGNPGGKFRDGNDHRRLRQGRMTNVGFKIGHYLQTPPMFFTRDGHTVPLIDRYRGRPAFLITGGPSFGKIDTRPLNQPGVLTMGYNNVAKIFRPNMWCGIDNPSHFLQSIWMDPRIEKFCPFDHADKPIVDSYTKKLLPITTGDCPNVWYFRRNEYFNADRYLFEDSFNWGNHGDFGGARSGVLAAIRILYLLGIRTLYLLGFDYKMSQDAKYCFDQARTQESIDGNNATFASMIERLTLLRPIFEKYGFNVLNCNPDSALRVFDFAKYEEAVSHCVSYLPDIANEPTEGLYDLKKEAKKPGKERTKEEIEAEKKKLIAEKLQEQKKAADDAQGLIPVQEIHLPSMTLNEAKLLKNRATLVLNTAKAEREELAKQVAACGQSVPTELSEQLKLKTLEVINLRQKRIEAIRVYDALDKK